MKSTRQLLVFVLTLCWLAPATGRGAQNPDCADENAHQFDFWIGDWEVYSNGNLAGNNSIQPILDGCVLLENWEGSQGGKGSSFNFFNPDTGKWQQFWVWKNGTTLELSGAFASGRMTLEGKSKNRAGEEVTNRITWYDNEDGTVRQHWEVSKDEGKTWNTVFDGLYKRKK